MAVGLQAGPAGPALSNAYYQEIVNGIRVALAVGAVAATSTVTEILAAAGLAAEAERY